MRYVFVGCLLLLLLGFSSNGFASKDLKIDSLEQRLVDLEPGQQMVSTLVELAILHEHVDQNKTRAYLEQANAYANGLVYGNAWLIASQKVARYYSTVGRYHDFLTSSTRILERIIKNQDTVGLSYGYSGVGLASSYLDRNAEALEYYLLALEVSTRDSLRNQGTLLLNIGNLYMNQGNYFLAENYYLKSKEFAEQLLKKDDFQEYSEDLLAYVHVSLAENFFNLDAYEQAHEQLKKALYYSKRLTFVEMEAYCYSLIGAYYTKIDQLDFVEPYLTKADSIYALAEDHEGKLLNAREWGDLEQARGNLWAAKARYQQYFALAEASGVINQLSKASKALATACSALGQHEEAYSWMSKAWAYRDSLREKENTFNVGRLESQLLLAKSKSENVALTQEKQLREKQLQNHRLLLVAEGTFLLMLIAVVIALHFAYRARVKTNQDLAAKNEEIALQQAEIIAQKESLTDLNNIKDQVFSMVSHDLRTPLLNIQGVLNLRNSGLVANEELDHVFALLQQETSRNLSLLDNLLFWARSQLKGFQLNPQALLVKKMTDDCLDLFKRQIENKKLQVSNSLSDDLAVQGDAHMIELVIRNLIHNAIKFTVEGGEIKLSGRQVGDLVEFEIEDTGVGMDEVSLNHILQGLHLSKPGTGKEKGTGLGLRVCMDFVKRNQGEFYLESESGRGTTVRFTLPAASCSTVSEQLAELSVVE